MISLGAMTAEHQTKLREIVWVDRERMSGVRCFRGTRVPVRMLLDYLKHGSTIDEFLQDCPTVSRAQAELSLELAGERLLECESS